MKCQFCKREFTASDIFFPVFVSMKPILGMSLYTDKSMCLDCLKARLK
jgi:hypothetical protein